MAPSVVDKMKQARLANHAAQQTGEIRIQRATYMLGGQAVALEVTGDMAGQNGLYYILSDQLGSANTLVKDGAVVSQQRFLPFGGPRSWAAEDNTPWQNRGYTGHLHNDEVGLIYMNARYYVPSLGRFASADTIIPNPANPQAFNRFSYARNNPMNRIDPTGHVDCGLLGDAADNAGCNTAKSASAPSQPTLPPNNLITHLPIAKDTAAEVDDIDWLGGFGANWYSQDPADCNQLCYGQSHNIHTGLDFGAKVGTTVYAAASGTVVLKYVREDGTGDAVPHVVIMVTVGDQTYYVVHGHVSPSVNIGAIVNAGDVIGTVSAEAKTPHVHLSIRQEDATGSGQDWAYNPLLFMAPELSAMLTIDNADKYYGNESPTSMVGFRYGTGSYFDQEARKNMEIRR